MAAMMPSSATSANPYDDDAVERDLIDPDDGASHAAAAAAYYPPLHMYIHEATVDGELTITSYPR